MKNLVTIMLLTGCAATSAVAGVTEYGPDERDDWFNDVGGPDNVTSLGFTQFAPDTIISDQYADLGVTFSGFNQTVTAPVYMDDWTLWIFNGNDLYFDKPIHSLSADFRGAITFELYAGDLLLHESSGFDFDPFFGLNSDIAFDRVRIYDRFDFLTDVDNLHFGPPIPAPATLAPLVMWMCARSGGRRR